MSGALPREVRPGPCPGRVSSRNQAPKAASAGRQRSTSRSRGSNGPATVAQAARGGGFAASTAAATAAPPTSRQNAARAAASGVRRRDGAPARGTPAKRWTSSKVLVHVALLSTACLAGGLLGRGRAGGGVATTATAGSESGLLQPAPAPTGGVNLAVVAPLNQQSPFGVSWREVLQHTARRLAWTDPDIRLTLLDSAPLATAGAAGLAAALAQLQGSQAAVAVGVDDPAAAAALAPLMAGLPTAVALGSAPQLQQAVRLGGRQPGGDSSGGGLAGLMHRFFPNKLALMDGQVLHTVEELYGRGSSDDFVFIFLVLANSYIQEVPAVAMSFKQKNAGLEELSCMVGKCGGQIFRCVTDSTCKRALDCLDACEFNDQVCSYRCITSYESPQFEEFSLCIIQKHNCFGLSAEIPMVPDPAPLTSWRGQALTHDAAEDLFIGWLQDPSTSLQPLQGREATTYSWRVFAGKNAAYDYFPCQYQLFYRGKGKGGMWYDPVFKVKTVDGREVWRRRHYRVKRDRKPGTFRFSVLDNGVTSSEFWRILDCDEGLDWCVFYYSGAASRAGLSYSGAILTSKSGDWPTSKDALQRIEASLEVAGIKMWELSNVDNSGCSGALLDPALMVMA